VSINKTGLKIAERNKIMKRYHFYFCTIFILLAIVFTFALGQSSSRIKKPKNTLVPAVPLVTFIELGSVRCIPCKAMQPVMKSIERKYGDQIKVIFYDVWKPEQEQFGKTYDIRLIPTQVFLNKDGKEFFRHEGFYPEAQIDTLLHKQGLKILKGE
jgi:thioredoxin 1